MVVLIAIIILLVGIFLLVLAHLFRRKAVIPVGRVIYSDSSKMPGEVLYAKSIPLIGKPDFIMKHGQSLIPIEIKRGKTPKRPYENHIAQLYAYCLLIKETYGFRPAYGVIKYPDKEFHIEFPDSLEDNLTRSVNEMLRKKTEGVSRKSLLHVCRQCKTHI